MHSAVELHESDVRDAAQVPVAVSLIVAPSVVSVCALRRRPRSTDGFAPVSAASVASDEPSSWMPPRAVPPFVTDRHPLRRERRATSQKAAVTRGDQVATNSRQLEAGGSCWPLAQLRSSSSSVAQSIIWAAFALTEQADETTGAPHHPHRASAVSPRRGRPPRDRDTYRVWERLPARAVRRMG